MVWPLTIKDIIDSPQKMDPIENNEKIPSAAAVGQTNPLSSTTEVANLLDQRPQQREEDDDLDFHDTSDIEFHDRREPLNTNRKTLNSADFS